EARDMDPQQRLLLLTAWEALEMSQIVPDTLYNSQTGVVVGISASEYLSLSEQISVYTATGGTNSISAGRISYVLGLKGSSLAVDTACSSGLISIHVACNSLHLLETDRQIVAAVNAILSPRGNIAFTKINALSLDGRCKTFDASANGYVRSEGCGVAILERFKTSTEEKEGEQQQHQQQKINNKGNSYRTYCNIVGIIKGTGVNQDGRSSGLTAPNGPSQQAVIKSALSRANVESHDISYVECHGTGTSLGDPIEVQALCEVLGKDRPEAKPLLIGSVKTNIGHTEAASGIAGLIKILLSFQYEEIPANLHFKQLNPHISLDNLPVIISTESISWPNKLSSLTKFFDEEEEETTRTKPKIAGLSSFGFSGTNAHAIIQQSSITTQVIEDINNEKQNLQKQIPWWYHHHFQILTLSAKSEYSLYKMIESFVNWFKMPNYSGIN
ncbi:MAG: polyketide synthase, partial [Propionibacteriaceae bacterium]|nr:polyketide synthase [Propionibacteriaceae bacterium]